MTEQPDNVLFLAKRVEKLENEVARLQNREVQMSKTLRPLVSRYHRKIWLSLRLLLKRKHRPIRLRQLNLFIQCSSRIIMSIQCSHQPNRK